MTTSAVLADILATLGAKSDPEVRRAMGEQYGIHAETSYGVPMRRLLEIARTAGTSHDLALDLWAQGSYETRTIAAIVDTVCFRLFDRTPHAWPMVDRWVVDDRLLVRRAGFALVWALALHDRVTPDDHFRRALSHARAHADDPRPLVGKAITMAMRAIATKRSALRADVVDLAHTLSGDSDPAIRRVGRPILRSFAPGAPH